MRLTQTLFPILCSAALFATMSLTAQGPPAAGRGKAKGNGHPGANHPGRIQALIITGQNPHDWHGDELEGRWAGAERD